jgi:hypothetical protein
MANKPTPSPSRSEAIQKLKLFNAKIETLRRGTFIPKVFHEDHGVTMNFSAESPVTVEKCGADEEATLALAVTLRFFVQERDGISLEQVARIYDSLPVPDQYKQSAQRAFESIEVYMDSPAGFNFNGETVTNRRLFNVFMYGGLAHANDDKRTEYEAWINSPVSLMMQYFFEDVAAHMVGAIVSFYAMNARTIEFLETGVLKDDENHFKNLCT